MSVMENLQPEIDELRRRLEEAEAALRALQARQRILADYAESWEFWIDPEGRFLYCSPSSEAITGHAADEFLADPGLRVRLIHPDDRRRFEEHACEVEERRLAGTCEWRYLRDDGTSHWVEHVCRPVFDDVGRYQGFRGSNHDITTRKQAEADLTDSRQKYRALLETTSDFIWETDATGHYTYCSPQLETLWGLKPAETIGQTPFDVMPPEDRERATRLFAELATSPRPFTGLESLAMVAGGQVIHAETSGVPFFDADGRLLGFRGISRDITARRHAEAALRESEARLRFAQASAGAGIWDCNIPAGTYEWSDELFRLFGLDATKAAASFESWTAVLHPDDREVAGERIRKAVESHSPLASEYRIVLPSGEVRWISALGDTGYDDNGTPVRMSGICVDITARKKAEQASRQILETVVHHMPASVALIRGSDLRVQLVNPAYQAIAPGKDLVGKTLDEAWPETGRDFSSLCRRVLESGEPHTAVDETFTIRRGPDAPLERASFSWSLHRVRLPGDEGWGILNTAWETTGRLKVEQALRRSREDLDRAQEVGQIGWWRLDVLHDVLTWSDENHRIFGVPKGTPLTYEAFLAIVHPDDREYVDAKWNAGLAGELYDIEHRIVADGRVKWVREKAYLERDDAGALLGGFGITQDITARKAAEEELRLSEAARRVAEATQAERQRFFDVLETLPAMICLLKPDYHVAFANRAFRDEFGEASGRPCYEYCFGKDAPCEFCQSFNVLRTGRPYRWEVTTPSGTVIQAHDFPFTDADGSQLILEMDIDITQWRRAEVELQDANKVLAQRAAQLRALAGELTLSEQRERRRLAGVLHDHLQQLLVAAKYRTAALRQAGDEAFRASAEDVERLLDTAISAARTLTAELSPPILQEAGLTAALQWLSRWMADRHGLQVTLEVEEELPPLAEDVKVLLFESVRELLFNAAKHARVGSADISVRRTADGNLCIAVSDRGVGFDPATLRHHGATGRGVGLLSIRERLELLGGSMNIDSAPGSGSRFTLTAPLHRIEAAACTVPDASIEVPIAAPAASSLKAARPVVSPGTQRGAAFIQVLIADDHAVVREGLRRLLSHERDMRVAGEAADGQEAIELAGTLRPDVILMDVSMPKTDGIEATRIIHRDHPGVRVIGLSMYEDVAWADAMREAGAVDYVTKSSPPGELLSAIRRVAGKPRARSGRAASPDKPRFRRHE